MDYYYLQDKNKFISVACIWINGGSNLDKKNKKGINSILTTLISRGCIGYDNFTLSEYIDSYGAEFNCESFEDGILITLKSLNKYFDKLSPLLELIIEKPNLHKKDFFFCKTLAKNNIIKSRENPFNIAYENWRKITYSQHKYAFEVNGYMEDINNINYEDIIEEFKSFQSRKKVFLSNRQVFFKSSKNIISFKQAEKLTNENNVQISCNLPKMNKFKECSLETNQVVMMIGNQTCPKVSKDSLTLKLLEAYLSYGMSSELFKQFREKNGFTYDQGVFFPSRMLNAPFLIYISVSNQNALKAFKLLIKIWNELRTKILTESEINLAKKKLYGSILSSQQNIEDIVSSKAQLIGSNLSQDFEENNLKNINMIKPKEIRRITNKYFKNSNLSIVGEKKITSNIKKIWLNRKTF